MVRSQRATRKGHGVLIIALRAAGGVWYITARDTAAITASTCTDWKRSHTKAHRVDRTSDPYMGLFISERLLRNAHEISSVLPEVSTSAPDADRYSTLVTHGTWALTRYTATEERI